MPITSESFLLKESEKFSLAKGAENRTDLVLEPNPDIGKAIVFGYVKYNQQPVVDAAIKIITINGDLADHQFTSANGLYCSRELNPGTYLVIVTAPGFQTTMPTTVNLPTAVVQADFTLTPDTRNALNTIYGFVVDQSSGKGLSNTTVVLSNSQGVVASTMTNSSGQYLISQIANGDYQIAAQKSGYETFNPLSIKTTGSQFYGTNITLAPELEIEGTIQGFIKDANGNLLAEACVGLYQINGTTETLIQTTFTNSNGFYLFGNVAAGNYLVKSKVDITI